MIKFEVINRISFTSKPFIIGMLRSTKINLKGYRQQVCTLAFILINASNPFLAYIMKNAS